MSSAKKYALINKHSAFHCSSNTSFSSASFYHKCAQNVYNCSESGA